MLKFTKKNKEIFIKLPHLPTRTALLHIYMRKDEPNTTRIPEYYQTKNRMNY